jgi:uncharacterized protein (DUF2252 family)
MRDPLDEFLAFNRVFASRSPELVRYKIERMAEGPFAFFRGSFHLFARDVLQGIDEPLPLPRSDATRIDIIGDIHAENYGTFKAADGMIHYDVNDFDETSQGRFDLDVCRLAVSFFLATRECGGSLTDAVAVTLAGLESYTETLRRLLKKSRDLSLDVSENNPCSCQAIDGLASDCATRKRSDFIEKLTTGSGARRQFRRGVHYFNLPDTQREQALRLLGDYRKRAPVVPQKNFFDVHDVAGRIAGIGSMGRYRYAILLEGKGSADARNVLLELKEARPSALDLYAPGSPSVPSTNRAERVVLYQRQSQAASNPFLGYAEDGELTFQVRELTPHDARVNWQELSLPDEPAGVAAVQAGILARIHARATSRAVGPVHLLGDLADPEAFSQRVLAFVLFYAGIVQRDWTRFVAQRSELESLATWGNPEA